MAARGKWRRKLRKAFFGLKRRLRAFQGPPVESGGIPRGIFQERREILAGRVEGRIVADGQPLPPLAADSEIRTCGLGQHQHAAWPVLWTHRRQARLLGGSLVHLDPKGRACHEAMFGPHTAGDPVWDIRAVSEAEFLPGHWTSLVSRWDHHGTNYYHWLTDALVRLVHLQDFPAETGILLRPGIARFAEDSLKKLGLLERVRFVKGEHLLVEDYWFAGPPALSGCPDPLGYEWLRRRFGADQREGAGHRKIFISRQGSTRGVANLREVEGALQADGWEIVDPGVLSFGEQVETFKQARIIAGIHGAGMTNILWAPPGTRVVELMPRTFRNGCYEGISLVLGHRHQVLLCAADGHGNMSVPQETLRQVLAAGD